MENKKKRYYKKGESVWLIAEKREAVVKALNKDKLEVTLMVGLEEKTLNMWEIDKLKYKAKEAEKDDKAESAEWLLLLEQLYRPTVYFAKVRDGAVIPSKRKEDAGYDVYAELSTFARKTEEGEVFEIECPLLATTLVPTGLAVAMPDTHYLNLKHERGSTAVNSMGVLAGVVDSGFRNEMFIALTPLHKAVLITSAVDKVEQNETHILYPLSKAIAQGTVDIVPDAKIVELTYDQLQAFDSERGMSMLGQSGK